VQLTGDKTHVKEEGSGVRGTGMNIAYEITMPASNKIENVAQYLIMQTQHKHSRFSRKRLCMHDAFAGIFTNSGFDLCRV
jgi:hypothetical protein